MAQDLEVNGEVFIVESDSSVYVFSSRFWLGIQEVVSSSICCFYVVEIA
jgi:hypothetical protein